VRLLSDEFNEAGYATGAVSSNPHITTPVFGDRFDWFAYFDTGTAYTFEIQRLLLRVLNRFGLSHVPVHFNIREAAYFHDLSKAFIAEQNSRDRPFFLYLSYLDVHDPYLREFEHVRDFAAEHGAALSRQTVNQVPEDVPGSTGTLEYGDVLNWGYDETIRYTDNQLAGLYSFLDREDLLDETVIVIMSDHGELLGDRNHWGHIDVPYNPLFEVPLLVDAPQVDGGTVDRVVSGAQIPSLLFDLLDVTPSEEMRAQWLTTLSYEELQETNDSATALVDFYTPEMSTIGYEHPVVGSDIERRSDMVTTHRLLVGDEWKLLQLDDQRLFYEYDDVFLDQTLEPSSVPEAVRERLQESMDAFGDALGDWDVADGDYYENVTDDAIRRQLEDLGYL
jgi:arylsulfatase A-like enzyme